MTTVNTKETDWYQFLQEVTDAWKAIADAKGVRLRPHWAKQWNGLSVGEQPIAEYLKSSYGKELEAFKTDFQALMTDWGVSLEDARTRFGNDTLSAVFGGIYL